MDAVGIEFVEGTQTGLDQMQEISETHIMKVALTVVITPSATVTAIGRKKPADESLVLVDHIMYVPRYT